MELLIRINDRDSADRQLYCSMTRRGDVIAAQPDGWVWSTAELTNPEWRILKMPTLTQAEADALTTPELDPSSTKAYTWSKRGTALYFEKQALPYKFLKYLRDATRQLSSYDVGQAGEDQLIRDLATDKGDATAVTAIFLGGPIQDIDVVVDVPYPIDVGSNFLGSQRPFTYLFTPGTLPPGYVFNDVTGIISGIPTVTGTYEGNRVRGIDADLAEFDSNIFRLRVMTQAQYDALYP